MKLENKDKQILEHIVRYCQEVQMAVNRFGRDEKIFSHDPVYMNSCSMPMLQMGELAKKLSDSFIASKPDIPWRQIKGMREFFAHDYHSMNKHVIWMTIINNVPQLQEQCEIILRETTD